MGPAIRRLCLVALAASGLSLCLGRGDGGVGDGLPGESKRQAFHRAQRARNLFNNAGLSGGGGE